jgi:hypothetical protein
MKNIFVLIIVFSGLGAQCFGQYLWPIPGGWLKEDGKTILLSYAETTFPSKNGYARFVSKGKYGCITIAGFEQIKPIYASLTDFNEGIAFAKKESGWIAINDQGNEIFKVIANFVYELNEGLARFQLGNRFGYLNSKGEVIIPASYAGAYDFKEGKARVYSNGKWGFIDTKGKLIIPSTFDYVADFTSGLAPFMKKTGKEEHWGYIDEAGKVVISAQLGYAFPFLGDYAIFRKGTYRGGQLMLIDKSGHTKLEINYQDATLCVNGLINVCKIQNGYQHWGYITTTGEIVIPFEFESKGLFNQQHARAIKAGKITYINKKGEVIWVEN